MEPEVLQKGQLNKFVVIIVLAKDILSKNIMELKKRKLVLIVVEKAQ